MKYILCTGKENRINYVIVKHYGFRYKADEYYYRLCAYFLTFDKTPS